MAMNWLVSNVDSDSSLRPGSIDPQIEAVIKENLMGGQGRRARKSWGL